MLTTETIIQVAVFIVAFIAILFPRFWLRNHNPIEIRIFAELHPELVFTKNNYNRISFAISLIFVIVASATDSHSPRLLQYLLPMILVLSAFFDGFLALATGLYPATLKFPCHLFVYDKNKALRWVAIVQLGLAVLVILASTVIFQIYNA